MRAVCGLRLGSLPIAILSQVKTWLYWKFSKTTSPNATTRFADTTVLPIGTELVHVGCTLGLYNSISRGMLSQTDRDILTTGRIFDQTTWYRLPRIVGRWCLSLTNGKCVGLLVRELWPRSELHRTDQKDVVMGKEDED